MTEFSMLFPGQGSQAVGMLGDLSERFDEVEETVRQAGSVLDLDLWGLMRNGPEADLSRTEITQPALLAAGVAVWRCWEESGGTLPTMMAGHSLGEYTALVCAGALDFEEAVALVADRGRFMQAAVPEGEGAMAAILGLEDDRIEAICRESAGELVVAPANINSPGQVVLAGHRQAVERACTACQEAGARRAMPLPVSVPSHCELMAPAARDLQARLEKVTIRPPEIPVLHNVDTGQRSEPDAIRQALVDQLVSPVLWSRIVVEMKNLGIEHMAECGPGRVLCGLNRRIDRTLSCVGLDAPDKLEATAMEWSET